jgi:hypothetical protein
MIYECTDCSNCADFDSGYRVICLHPELQGNDVEKYFPVGNHDAEDCEYFDDGESPEFSTDEFMQAEKYSEEKYGEIDYPGIREWCLTKLEFLTPSGWIYRR